MWVDRKKRRSVVFEWEEMVGVLQFPQKIGKVESVIVVSRIFACHALSVRDGNFVKVKRFENNFIFGEIILIVRDRLRFEYFNEP